MSKSIEFILFRTEQKKNGQLVLLIFTSFSPSFQLISNSNIHFHFFFRIEIKCDTILTYACVVCALNDAIKWRYGFPLEIICFFFFRFGFLFVPFGYNCFGCPKACHRREREKFSTLWPLFISSSRPFRCFYFLFQIKLRLFLFNVFSILLFLFLLPYFLFTMDLSICLLLLFPLHEMERFRVNIAQKPNETV